MTHPPLCSLCPSSFSSLGDGGEMELWESAWGNIQQVFEYHWFKMSHRIDYIQPNSSQVLLTIPMKLLPFYCVANKVRITFLCNSWCEHWQHYPCWFWRPRSYWNTGLLFTTSYGLCVSVFVGQFSPEEDERKKRRRERNKIAAAKCRNKKKEKTECLQKVSDWLEFLICHPARIQTDSIGYCHSRKYRKMSPKTL